MEEGQNPELQTVKQKAIAFALDPNDYAGAVELLRRVRTQVTTVEGATEFETVKIALKLEYETQLIHRFVKIIDDIRNGKEHLNDEF